MTSEDLEPNVRIYYVPARKAGVSAFYRTWQPLLNEHVDAVHVMGDNALGVPGLYRFCRDHDIFFYSQLGAIKSTSENPVMRAVMDLLCRRNLAIYRKTPTYAKTPAVAAQLEQLHVPCAGVMPVGLDTAIIPNANGEKHELREFLKLDPKVSLHWIRRHTNGSNANGVNSYAKLFGKLLSSLLPHKILEVKFSIIIYGTILIISLNILLIDCQYTFILIIET